MKKILLVEDDPSLSQNINEALVAEQFEVVSALEGLLAEKFLRKNDYACVILDINLPNKNGYELCKDFRKYNTITPVLILTAFDEIEDKVHGYECGADDYLTKPFYMKELVLRIKALMKREHVSINEQQNSSIVSGDIVIYPVTKKVIRQNTEIVLTPREYQILLRLVSAKGELVQKKELIKEIWGASFDVNTNTIEVYINFLRKKIDKPFGKDSIKTKIGFGYYFDER
ncbi:MAG: response regulator transcription factor [Chryseolinea sp.]